MSVARIFVSVVAGAAAYAVGVYGALFVVLSIVGLSVAVEATAAVTGAEERTGSRAEGYSGMSITGPSTAPPSMTNSDPVL